MSEKDREAFEQFLIDGMGPHVLAGDTMSMHDAMLKAWQAALSHSAAALAEKDAEIAHLQRVFGTTEGSAGESWTALQNQEAVVSPAEVAVLFQGERILALAAQKEQQND